MVYDQSGLPYVWNCSQWIAYFKENAENQRVIPWVLGAGVSEEEVMEIAGRLRSP